MPSTPTLKREPNGKIYMHWTEPSPVKGQRGRSRRRSTGTDEMAKAKLVLGRLLLNATFNFSAADGEAARRREQTLDPSPAQADASSRSTSALVDEFRRSLKRSPTLVKRTEPETQLREKIDVRDGSLTLPAAIRLAIALNRCSPDEHGFVSADGPKLFHVRKVTPQHAARVVRLVQTLLSAAAARGDVIKADGNRFAIVVDGEPTVLSIKEFAACKRERIVYSARNPNGGWRPQWRSHYTPTGRLAIQIETGYFDFYVRRLWSDTPSGKLEDKLSYVLAGLAAHAAALKRQRAHSAIRQQEMGLERRRAEHARHEAEVERARIEFLAQRLRTFEEMQQIGRLLEQLKAFASREEQLPPLYQAFVQWAESRAETLRQACCVEKLEAALARGGLFTSQLG